MQISCEQVVREMSNYIEGEVEQELREQIAAHLSGCDRCKAVYDGTRNVIKLVCDQRTFTLPTGFSERLYKKLAK